MGNSLIQEGDLRGGLEKLLEANLKILIYIMS